MTEQNTQRSHRETKKGEWRRQIAHAAVTLFEEKGFSATTMDEIAASSGVSRQSVFNYFTHKEEIPAFFMGVMLEERVASRLGAWSALPPLEALRSCMREAASIFGEFRETARTFHMLKIQEGRQDDRLPEGHPMLGVMTHLVAWIARAQADGVIRTDFTPREIMPHIAIGLLVSTYKPWMMGECGDVPFGDVVAKHFDLLVGGLRA